MTWNDKSSLSKTFLNPWSWYKLPKGIAVFIFLWANLCMRIKSISKVLYRLYWRSNYLQVPTMKHPFLRCKLLHHCVSCCPLDLLARLVATLKTWPVPLNHGLGAWKFFWLPGPFQTYVDFSKRYSCTTWFQMSKIKSTVKVNSCCRTEENIQ